MGYSYKDAPIFTGGYLWNQGYDQFRVRIDSKKLERNLESVVAQYIDELKGDADYYMGIGEILLDGMREYVPYKTGRLSSSAARRKSTEGVNISYSADYAEKVYDNPGGWTFRTTHHQYATDHWDRAYLRDHGDEFYAEVNDFTMDYLKRKGFNVEG